MLADVTGKIISQLTKHICVGTSTYSARNEWRRGKEGGLGKMEHIWDM